MFGRNIKKAFLASSAVGALIVGLDVAPAAADTVPTFNINPNVLGVTGYSTRTESDINGTSDGLVRQTSATTQVETGWVQFSSFTNNGAASNFGTTGLLAEDNTGTATIANVYGLYLTFTATATSITGFGAGQIGTIAPGDFTFTMFADLGQNDVFNAGATNSGSGVAPTVSDTGSNDVVLAKAVSVSGSAGFQPITGAPTFNAISSFILCDGTVNEGVLGGKVIVGGDATGCGTFDARTYFTAPVPFYSFDFASTTAGSAQDVNSTSGATTPNATINGIVVDVNFKNIPEPGTLGMFGVALMALGGLIRRRSKAQA